MGNILSRASISERNSNNKRTHNDVEIEPYTRLKRARRPGSSEGEKREAINVKESDVGIVAYVNPNLKGFHSILKYMPEDFLVNEVDMDNNIVYLTSVAPPDIKKKEPIEKTEIFSAKKFDKEVSRIIDEDFAIQLRKFLNNPKQIDATISYPTDKHKRLEFYKLVEEHSDANITYHAREGKLIVGWLDSRDADEFIDWKNVGGDYLQMTMHKAGWDTMNAISLISKRTGIPNKTFCFAGTKDARAITTQTLTLKNVKPKRVLNAQKELQEYDIYIGDFKYVPKGLTLGDLKGNHFTIVLRDVKGANENELDIALQSLRDNGYLNYFGMQRFGTSSVLTHTVGCAIMKKQFELASNLILNPRDGDSERYNVARQIWKDTHDAKAALEAFPRKAFAEHKLLRSYTKFPDNHEKAIKSLPKHMLSLYSHAYQSYIWNRVVSERVRLFGSDKPLAGDLVMIDNPHILERYCIDDNRGRRNFAERKIPKVLTEDDIQLYTIQDVVYPLPGRSTVYPENQMKDIYIKFMAEDGISIDRQHKHFQDLSGDYRLMLSKPEQMSWCFLKYDDPSEKLCNTDIDRLNKKTEPSGVPGNLYFTSVS
ncbi:pseudouridine synthase [Mycotypha africana]|uniref:pseudouridine synthase n=1 Tax=Mycotypha africana TaxID=64632 RepID=UPI0023000EA1|nr:pseudouridine synthase [Mycotypha africana]KAI8991489.1 pseudouridine synthase [Mycotypha africana]